MNAATAPVATQDAALGYARRGWLVFPLHSPARLRATGATVCSCNNPACISPAKHPRTPHGCKDASVDEAVIRAWGAKWPHAGVGIVTGAVSGLVVLDVDDRHGGDETLAKLEREHGPLPGTVEVLTGGGGRHIYFSHPGGVIRNKAGSLGPGLDLRGDGGYVVAPPSRHMSGRRYAWEAAHDPEETPLAPPPAWLLSRINGGVGRGNGTHPEVAEAIPEGSRNTTLTSLAGTMRHRGMTPEGILAALRAENDKRCRPPLPDAEVEAIARSISRYDRGPTQAAESATVLGAEAADTPSESWPEPAELPGGLLPVPRFPEKIIPESFRPWIVDIAERFQCPVEFPAVGALVVLGAAVGRSIGIRPKRLDDWTAVPNLWGGIIGRPGIMKSPALSEVMKPLHRLDARSREEHDAEVKRYEIEKAIAKVERDAEIRAAAKDGDKKALLLDSATCSEPTPPTARRYIVNDSTVEKLGEILNANPRGVQLFRDELTGWLRTLDREGHEGDRAFFLESWNGTGSFTYDRIGRGTVHILAACVSVLGGIQPGPLGDYLRACVKGGAGDDGLMQRFQLLVYPDASTTWRNVDRRPDIEARNRAWEIVERLASADPHTSMSAEPGEIPFLRFDDEAQALFDEWRADLERKIRSGEEAPVLEAHLAKFRSLMPSLALLVHLAEIAGGGVPGPVSVGAAEMAAAWCELLEAHARRIYQSVTERHHVAARLLGQKIRAGKLPDPFTARDVYLKGWGGLDGPEEVVRAAEVLEAAGWVRSETRQPAASGGRPSTAYHVNPEVLKVLKVPEVGVLGENGGQS